MVGRVTDVFVAWCEHGRGNLHSEVVNLLEHMFLSIDHFDESTTFDDLFSFFFIHSAEH